MTMLNGRLTLHDCHDVEALCTSILQRRGGNELPWHRREEALSYLIATCWELSLDYDPARNPTGHTHPNGGFTGYAAHILKRRYSEWLRSGYRTRWTFADRVYERPQPTLIPLDHRAGNDQLDHPHTPLTRDPTDDRSPDLMRALRKGSSPTTRPTNTLGTRPTRRAA